MKVHQSFSSFSSSRYLLRCRRCSGAGRSTPPTIITISPRGGFASKCTDSSESVPRTVLSWSFDISRETDAGRSAPQASASCVSVFTSRRGDSYIIKVHDRAASISMRLARPFSGAETLRRRIGRMEGRNRREPERKQWLQAG